MRAFIILTINYVETPQKPPVVAGEPIANLMLNYEDRDPINGTYFKLDKLVKKPDKAMNDEVLGKRLWDELVQLTELTS